MLQEKDDISCKDETEDGEQKMVSPKQRGGEGCSPHDNESNFSSWNQKIQGRTIKFVHSAFNYSSISATKKGTRGDLGPP